MIFAFVEVMYNDKKNREASRKVGKTMEDSNAWQILIEIAHILKHCI